MKAGTEIRVMQSILDESRVSVSFWDEGANQVRKIYSRTSGPSYRRLAVLIHRLADRGQVEIRPTTLWAGWKATVLPRKGRLA